MSWHAVGVPFVPIMLSGVWMAHCTCTLTCHITIAPDTLIRWKEIAYALVTSIVPSDLGSIMDELYNKNNMSMHIESVQGLGITTERGWDWF